MPKSTLLYKLLISCPSDIENEINIIKNIIQNFNKTLGDAINTKIETLYWKDDIIPQMGEDGQSIINKQIVKDADAVIAIFGEKSGSPTPRHKSGTIEEIEKMLEAKKQVFLYFSNKPINRNIRNSDELDKIDEFKEKYRNKGIYSEYKDDDDFKEKVNRDILKYFSNMDKYNGTYNDKKLTIKSYNNGILKDNLEYHEIINNSRSMIDNEKEKIIELIEEIKNIDLGIPNNFLNYFLNSASYVNNAHLITSFTSDNNISIDKNTFFYLGNYHPDNNYSREEWRNIYTGEKKISYYYGKFKNEKRKYDLICELINNIYIYNIKRENIEYLSDIKCLSLAVVNENNEYDENIEVCIKVPKDNFINKDYFNDEDLDAINEIIFENIFKCKKTLENIIISCYDNQISIKDTCIETINQLYDKYDIDINDNTINIMFEIKKLNSSSGIWFPSVLFFNEEIEEITYFITSKNLGKTESVIKKEKQE